MTEREYQKKYLGKIPTDHEVSEYLNCENLKLRKQNAELKATLQHREHCIDWIMENYPEVISKYLEVKYE